MSSGRQHYWMAAALRQARKGIYSTPPNPAVGCVIVAGDERLAAGWHEYTGGPHAEVNAIAAADIPAGAEFYVTLEPCSHHGRTPPCVDALIAAKPSRVVVAMQDPNPEVSGRGLQILREAGIEVDCGIMQNEATELNRGFVKRMTRGLPFVSVKMACSLDGRSALSNGVSHWITGDAARRDVQFLRARAAAILTSAKTVQDDDPALDLRLSADELKQARAPRQPVRVVLDSRLSLSGDEKLFGRGGDIWIYTLSQNRESIDRLEQKGARVIAAEADALGRIDLAAMLADLGAKEINEIHTECGARLAGAIVGQGLADQVVLYLAPHLLGSAARGGFDLGELTSMQQRPTLALRDLRQIGDDLRLTLSLEQA